MIHATNPHASTDLDQGRITLAVAAPAVDAPTQPCPAWCAGHHEPAEMFGEAAPLIWWCQHSRSVYRKTFRSNSGVLSSDQVRDGLYRWLSVDLVEYEDEDRPAPIAGVQITLGPSFDDYALGLTTHEARDLAASLVAGADLIEGAA